MSSLTTTAQTPVLLRTFNNPAPEGGDHFGIGLAALGGDRVLIGAPFDDAGATDAGSVYLFSVPAAPGAPSLTIHLTTTNTVVVSWPSAAAGFALQQNTNGVSSVNWSNVTAMFRDDGTTRALTVNPATGNRFYRLFKL